MKREELRVGDEVLAFLPGFNRARVCEVTSLEPAHAHWPTSVRVMTPRGGERYVSLRNVIRKTEFNATPPDPFSRKV